MHVCLFVTISAWTYVPDVRNKSLWTTYKLYHIALTCVFLFECIMYTTSFTNLWNCRSTQKRRGFETKPGVSKKTRFFFPTSAKWWKWCYFWWQSMVFFLMCVAFLPSPLVLLPFCDSFFLFILSTFQISFVVIMPFGSLETSLQRPGYCLQWVNSSVDPWYASHVVLVNLHCLNQWIHAPRFVESFPQQIVNRVVDHMEFRHKCKESPLSFERCSCQLHVPHQEWIARFSDAFPILRFDPDILSIQLPHEVVSMLYAISTRWCSIVS